MFSTNNDFVNSPEDVISSGPRVGFQQANSTAYNAVVSEAANKATDIEDMYYKQNKTLRDLGEMNIPDVSFFGGAEGHVNVRDLEAVYSGNEPFYQTQQEFDLGMSRVRAYDEHVKKLREKYPDANLRTSEDFVKDFQASTREAARQNAEQRRTFAGSVGAFIGEVGAGIDPRYNLFNTLTLGVGGFGKTALTRIGTEAAGQAGIEAINEFAGGRSTRAMRGLDSSLSGSITRIATAGIGGGLIRGAGEGVAAGFKAGRRWFSDMPNDPAPPPPKADFTVDSAGRATDNFMTPEQAYALQKSTLQHLDPEMTRTRMGTSRVISDLEHTTERLNDWGGEMPSQLKPRGDAAIPERVDGVRFSDDITTRAALGQLTPDELARRADPDVFRVYDELSSRAETLRLQLTSTKPDTAEWTRMITEANNKVSDLTDQIGSRKLKPKERTALTAQRDAAIAERDTLMAQPRTNDTPRQAEMRDELQKADYKMRDLAPTINRAYARARGQFINDAKTAAAVKRMVAERRPRLADEDLQAMLRDVEKQTPDKQTAGVADTPITSRMNPGEIDSSKPVVEAALKVVERDAKLAEESLDAFRESLNSILKDEKGGKVTIGNHEFDLKKDILEVPNLDGEGSRRISVGELLDEMREADYEVKAVKTCSI